MATHSSILAWRIHGQRRLAGYSPWGHQELDMTELLTDMHSVEEVRPILQAPHPTGQSQAYAWIKWCQV